MQTQHFARFARLVEKSGTMFFSDEGHFFFQGAWGSTGQPTLFTGSWLAVNDSVVKMELEKPFQETWKIVIRNLDKEEMDFYYLFEKE